MGAALLVLLGLGCFVAGILTGTTWLYWACVASCAVAAVLLVATRRQIATEGAARGAQASSDPAGSVRAAGSRAAADGTAVATPDAGEPAGDRRPAVGVRAGPGGRPRGTGPPQCTRRSRRAPRGGGGGHRPAHGRGPEGRRPRRRRAPPLPRRRVRPRGRPDDDPAAARRGARRRLHTVRGVCPRPHPRPASARAEVGGPRPPRHSPARGEPLDGVLLLKRGPARSGGRPAPRSPHPPRQSRRALRWRGPRRRPGPSAR